MANGSRSVNGSKRSIASYRQLPQLPHHTAQAHKPIIVDLFLKCGGGHRVTGRHADRRRFPQGAKQCCVTRCAPPPFTLSLRLAHRLAGESHKGWARAEKFLMWVEPGQEKASRLTDDGLPATSFNGCFRHIPKRQTDRKAADVPDWVDFKSAPLG